MPYTPTNWEDFPDTDTPITAAQLNRMETGIDLAVDLGEAALPITVVNANGDLIVGTANDTVARLPVGANSTVLMADSAQSSGMQWTSDLSVAALAPGSESQVLTTVSGAPAWATPSTGVPTGTISAYAGSAAPTGYLLCDGSAVSRTGQAALFAVCGTTYGSGDGSTTFNLPDLRGRMPVGKGTNAAVDTLGESEGVTEANRRPQHRHTPHNHTSTTGPTAGSGAHQVTGAANPQNTGLKDGGSGVATDPLDSPAYLTLNFIIKT